MKRNASRFDRLLGIVALGSRIGFAGGLGLATAEVSAGLAPVDMRSAVFAVSGGMAVVMLDWLMTRVVLPKKPQA